ncbi:unnamed protein product [Owenia fusiformis]|uniref:Endo-1,5-alpha-L-arabinanase A n=1 Tax=Owenia fusiformis TaxID=6347 RepID=A0A8J1XKR9_OWEFU|nr:unnamed protein product [Owenia fusiformis]
MSDTVGTAVLCGARVWEMTCNELDDGQEGHDPARMVKHGPYFIVYYSGLEQTFIDPVNGKWNIGLGFAKHGFILKGDNLPRWIYDELGDKLNGDPIEPGTAPGMLNETVMYYCVTDWDLDDGSACIGRAVAQGDPPFPTWVDDGKVICSTSVDAQLDIGPFNIDPAAFNDYEGRTWLIWGSHYSGIWMLELDYHTGHLFPLDEPGWDGDNPNYIRVASAEHDGEDGIVTPDHRDYLGGQIESAFVTKHNNWYYLFVNWGRCCRGHASTYNIRVGRSRSPSGPYLDDLGRDMKDRAGKQFLQTEGRHIGPGHAGVLEYTNGSTTTYIFTYHYYDRDMAAGTARIVAMEMTWSADDWPVLSDTYFNPYPDPLHGKWGIQTKGTQRYWHEDGLSTKLINTVFQGGDAHNVFMFDRTEDGSYRIRVEHERGLVHEHGIGDQLLSTRFGTEDDHSRYFFELQPDDGSYRIRVKANGRYVSENADQTIGTLSQVDDDNSRFFLTKLN